jgi:8-oxo-dGTP diphosphatase
MQVTNLIYVFNLQGQVLLCAKVKTHSGFTISLGKWNAPGGKLEEWETAIQAAIRELEEEVWIKANESQLVSVGVLTFLFESKKEREQTCHVYKVVNYEGEFEEREEMKPQWFDTEVLPFENMRASDQVWISRMIAWDTIEYIFHMTDDWWYKSYEQIQ